MERRSYRPPQEAAAPKEEKAVETPPKPESASQEKRLEAQTGEKSKFVNITGLFRTKSGKADTIFITEAIAEKLHEILPGDTLGVNENPNNQRLQLWYIPGEAE